MSLDIYLNSDTKRPRKPGSGIFIREAGKTIEISREEWDRRNPDREPVTYTPEATETYELYHDNITHNLSAMAGQAGLFDLLWRSEGKTAEDLISPLMAGYRKLYCRPYRFKKLNPENGWGTYDQLVEFTGNFLLACIRHPKAKVEISR